MISIFTITDLIPINTTRYYDLIGTNILDSSHIDRLITARLSNIFKVFPNNRAKENYTKEL